jgi:hypothetical protein
MIAPSTIPEQRTNVMWRMGLSCTQARTRATCHRGTPVGLSSTARILYISLVRNEITAAPEDFQSRLRALLGLRGAVLTDDELSVMAESYARCGGKGPWDVRQYVARGGAGAREYRVVRGTSVQDVYRCPDRLQADAVGTALNELEAEQRSADLR